MPKVKRRSARLSAKTKTPYNKAGEADSTEPVVQATVTTSSSSTSEAMQLVQDLRMLFLRHASSHPQCSRDAPAMSKYMRNKFVFFGVKTPERRKITSEFVQAHREQLKNRRLFCEMLPLLWQQDEREFQSVGCDLMSSHRELVLGSSDEEFHEAMRLTEELVTTKSWWDTVDALSYSAGFFVHQRPKLGVPLIHQWVNHDNMWLRRAAIIHQNHMKDRTDKQLLFKFCLARAHEDEFFIRKAIGWALRSYSWTAGEQVRAFVEENRDKLSALSVKEALKHC